MARRRSPHQHPSFVQLLHTSLFVHRVLAPLPQEAAGARADQVLQSGPECSEEVPAILWRVRQQNCEPLPRDDKPHLLFFSPRVVYESHSLHSLWAALVVALRAAISCHVLGMVCGLVGMVADD